MLAARDQENLVHVHQTAAASKPLNQGIKTLQPKTPGNKVPKTPFKIPLNDKAGNTVLGGGKNGLKARAAGNENLVTGGKKGVIGDKTAFVTPLATRNRAPLGFKTTNAKAKPFQTPGTLPLDNEAKKGEGKGIGLKASVSHGEANKLTVLEDLKDNNESEEEIEYMPPKAKELPDLPDDLPHEIDLSLLKNGTIQPGYLHHFVTRVGPDGLTFYERKEKERQRVDELADRISEATFTRDFESLRFPCIHRQECPGDECSASIANRQAAEIKYQKTIAALTKHQHPKDQIYVTNNKKADRPNGPSTLTSKSAASALSQHQQHEAPSPLKAKPTTKVSHLSKTTSILSRPRKAPAAAAPQPTKPSTMRHTAASALSKTTIGRSRGRATSAAMRTTSSIRPPSAKDTNAKKPSAAAAAARPDQTFVPAERSAAPPRIGSEQWIRIRQEQERAGCLKETLRVPEPDAGAEVEADVEAGAAEAVEEEGEEVGGSRILPLDDWVREEAEKEFQL